MKTNLNQIIIIRIRQNDGQHEKNLASNTLWQSFLWKSKLKHEID